MKSESIHPRFLPWVRAIILPTAALLTLLFLACSAYGQSLPGFQAPEKPKPKDDTPNAVKAARGEVPFGGRMYGHLKLDPAKTKRLGPISDLEQKRKNSDKFLRIGIVRGLTTPLDPLSDSALYTVSEGYIRVAGVVSEGAAAVRVQFKDMTLPQGARVFVYSPTNPNEFYGPFDGRSASDDGTFWTPAIHGDTAVIEYFTPAGAVAAKNPFTVSSIAHVYKDLSDPLAAASCELEVTAEWQNVAKSVGRIDFVSNGFVGSCTGTLLNNQANDQKPYFLTANHCISLPSEAQSALVYWNYNTGDTPPFGTPSTSGANLLATAPTSDFTLLLLTGNVPGGLFFSGWDTAPFVTTASATGIHHPETSHKRISFGTARQPNPGDCFPGKPCIRVGWSSGITEAGSSGSGLWLGSPADAGGPRLIGTLTGGQSGCNVSPANNWDVYGRFSDDFPSITSFLTGPSCVTSLSQTSQFFTESGGTGSFTITSPGGCNWTAVSSDSFVTVTSGANGAGNGTVNFSVASNSGPQRTTTIVAGGQSFIITQGGGGVCAPTPISIGQTVNGNLTTNDCPLGDGTLFDAYSFSATAGQRIAISMSSADFDAFLILNRPDGSTLTVDDDGGGGTNSRIPGNGSFISLPVTGTYTIFANALDPDDTTGAYSLSISVPVPRNLTIASSNPNSGVGIQVVPADNNGVSNGTTEFTVTYDQFTTVTVIAPGTAGDDLIFLRWLKDGADYSPSNVTTITLDVNHTLTAVYGPIPTFTLTVASTNPGSGVPITVSPNDNGGSGNGTTQFTRTYQHFTTVTLSAPISAGGNNYFQKWQRDGVDLTTTRTTTVNMGSNHTMTAVYVTLPPQPTPTPTPTPNGPTQAVAYQIDPAHTGAQADTISPPLVQRWSRDLGSSVSYPLIAGGRVFVIAGSLLYGLNGTNGTTVWGPIELGTSYPGIAYESGRVFAINRSGLLRGFDATNGTQVWSRQLQGQSFTSPPTAVAGTVYVNGFSTLYAVNTQDGTVKWSVANAGSEHSSPAVTANAVYITSSCDATAFSPATGSVIWRTTSSCFGSGGKTPVFYNSRVYIRDNDVGNVALDAGTGIPVLDVPSGPAPAFHGSTGFFLKIFPLTLEARDIFTGALKWSFTGDGTLSTAPLVVNGTVYIGSTSGNLYAVDESTGVNVWTGTVGAQVIRPDEHNVSIPLTGLGAGEGLIVVPASNLVVAYEAAPVAPEIYAEDNSNNAAAIDSVTFARGPFRLPNANNFSSDQRTRVIIFTSSLGLTQASLSDPTALVVEAGGVNLPVENVGPLVIPGLNSSYIIVKLPDNLPTGQLQLKVKLRGITSGAKILNISP